MEGKIKLDPKKILKGEKNPLDSLDYRGCAITLKQLKKDLQKSNGCFHQIAVLFQIVMFKHLKNIAKENQKPPSD